MLELQLQYNYINIFNTAVNKFFMEKFKITFLGISWHKYQDVYFLNYLLYIRIMIINLSYLSIFIFQVFLLHSVYIYIDLRSGCIVEIIQTNKEKVSASSTVNLYSNNKLSVAYNIFTPIRIACNYFYLNISNTIRGINTIIRHRPKVKLQ